ncbi:ABC transporter substrate-binding protein [Lipingzhangella sp. LS1_29]|uniref:ABC transporter substrate-binding protein n=1 Tax=Lipingzhangella rawalii TaxID=2055835 RepID=A0ABU2HCV0_9ACTN|nr:ABC transporter substrate-binding protein [Lipingzhangella rawalii]MDS1272389.1 ABC transporter substrate-binding protein [Lipingzhangella rawalii]
MTSHDKMRTPGRGVGRRGFLAGSLGLAAAAALGSTLAACSRGADGAAGGLLRVGAAGAATETLNVPLASAMSDYIAMFALFDPLVVTQGDEVVLRLAEDIEANDDATEYTIRIRTGVEFHDGRPCTAEDVAYSLTTLADPEASPNFAQFYADLDVENFEVLDEHTLRVPLHRPRADFVAAGLAVFSLVFPDGTSDDDWEDGIGTGPFRLSSTDGGTRLLERNDNYWDETAALDEVEIRSIDDAETRMEALRGGEIDYAHAISPADAATAEEDDSLQIVRGGPSDSGILALHMNLQQEPFDDPDVRLAMKLLVDRQAMIDTILYGEGTVGNDVVGQGLAGFNEDLPQRERDVDRARDLLESAGVSSVTLRVAELSPGMVDAAHLLAEQAAEAGLTVEIDEDSADTYYSDMEALLNTPFQSMFWANRPATAHVAGFTGSRGGFNVTGLTTEAYDELLDDMQATTDDGDRQRALDELQEYLWENGGDVIWGFAGQLDATLPEVEGIDYIQSLPRLERVSRTS